jgi:hypothetical protein
MRSVYKFAGLLLKSQGPTLNACLHAAHFILVSRCQYVFSQV